MKLAVETVLERFTTLVGGALLVGMTTLITVDVLLRSVNGVGLPATSEIVARYQMVAISFLPIALAEVGRQHVEATVFFDRLPCSIRTVISACGIVLSILIYAMLTFVTGRLAYSKFSTRAFVEVGQIDFVTWPSYLLVPFSFFLMTIALVLRLLFLRSDAESGTFTKAGKDCDDV